MKDDRVIERDAGEDFLRVQILAIGIDIAGEPGGDIERLDRPIETEIGRTSSNREIGSLLKTLTNSAMNGCGSLPRSKLALTSNWTAFSGRRPGSFVDAAIDVIAHPVDVESEVDAAGVDALFFSRRQDFRINAGWIVHRQHEWLDQAEEAVVLNQRDSWRSGSPVGVG